MRKGNGEVTRRELPLLTLRGHTFYAPSKRPTFVEIPIEYRNEGDEKMVGRLELSLYGTRDAARNWSEEYTTSLKQWGFHVGRSSPCNFRHKERDITMTVHGDDFAVTASTPQSEWLKSKMKSKYDIKMDILGHDEGQEKEVEILSRVIRWTTEGLEYEADQRHADLLVKEMGVGYSREVATLAVTNRGEKGGR